jgi:YQGE family putative transporter
VVFKTIDPLALFGYGCVYGIGYGFYWANRNYLELQETVAEGRQYYFSIIQIVGSLSSVFVPFIAGWFIVLGKHFGLYSVTQAYWILFGVSFVLLVVSGSIISGGTFESPVPRALTRFTITPFFNKRRLLAIAGGAIDGLAFVPALLVLMLLGNEGVLGTVTAIVSLCTIFLTYYYGRMFSQKHQYKVLVVSSAVLFLCTLGLTLFPGLASLLVYVVCFSVGSTFFVLAFEPLSLLFTEQEMAGDATLRYAFIVDNETFLNMGRLLSLAVGIGACFIFSEKIVLLVGPLLAAYVQVFFLVMFFMQHSKKTKQ